MRCAAHRDAIAGICTTCHNTPKAGDHSVPLTLDITDVSRCTPDLPLYTLRNTATGQLIEKQDLVAFLKAL